MDKLYLMFKQFTEKKPFYEYYDFKKREGNSEEIIKENKEKWELLKSIYKKIYELHPELIDIDLKTKIEYNEEELKTIYGEFYELNEHVRAELKTLLEQHLKNTGEKKHLNQFFELSSTVKNMASRYKMTIPEFKKYIEYTYGSIFGFGKEGVVDNSQYYSFKETISKEEKTKAFEEAAASLGIILKKNLNDRFVEYDFDKLPSENRKIARNNMLLNILANRLMDKETFIERYTPGGFFNASRAAKILRLATFNPEKNGVKNIKTLRALIELSETAKDPEPNYDLTDPMTMIIYNQQNQIASKLIGIFANLNTNHAISLFLDELSLHSSIKFFGHDYKDLIHAPDGVDVNGNVAELLAAAVDAVKDPTLGYLNLNTLTADDGALLVRLGYKLEEVGILLNQPVIKRVCEKAFNENISIDKAIDLIKMDYAKLKHDFTKNYDHNMLTEEHLIKNLYDENDNVQVNVLHLYSQIKKASKDLANYISSTKYTASNSVGSTFGEFYTQEQKVDNFISKMIEGELALNIVINGGNIKVIDNDISLLELDKEEYIEKIMQHPFGYELCMFDMNRKIQKKLLQYFPYGSLLYKNIRKGFLTVSKNNVLSAKTIDLIHKDFLVYMLSLTAGVFNPNYEIDIDGKKMTTKEYFNTEFSKRLYEIIKLYRENGIHYTIFSKDYLTFYEDSNGNFQCALTNVGHLNSILKDELMRSWEDLNKENPDLARDLFLYNFHKTGFNFTPTSFMSYTPTSVKKDIIVHLENGLPVSYIEFLNKITLYNITISDFIKLFILNHSDNYELVTTLNKKAREYMLNKKLITDNNIKSTIELSLADLGSLPQLVIKNTKESTLVIPAFKYTTASGQTYLYVLENLTTNNLGRSIVNEITGQVTYVLTDPQGYTNISTTYMPVGGTYSLGDESNSQNNLYEPFRLGMDIDNDSKNSDTEILLSPEEIYNMVIKNIAERIVEETDNIDLQQAMVLIVNKWQDLSIDEQKKILDRSLKKEDFYCKNSNNELTLLC